MFPSNKQNSVFIEEKSKRDSEETLSSHPIQKPKVSIKEFIASTN